MQGEVGDEEGDGEGDEEEDEEEGEEEEGGEEEHAMAVNLTMDKSSTSKCYCFCRNVFYKINYFCSHFFKKTLLSIFHTCRLPNNEEPAGGGQGRGRGGRGNGRGTNQ